MSAPPERDSAPLVAPGPLGPVGSVGPRGRVLTPDVARGLALLGIALANSVVQLYGRPLGPGSRQRGSSRLDHTVDVAVTVLVDNRAICLFSLLFGYGVVMILRRQESAGVPFGAAAGMLARRDLGLITLGLLHAWLLFEGDILATYGLLGLVLLLAVRLPRRALLWLAALLTVALAWLDSFDGTTGGATEPALFSSVTDPAAAMALRLEVWTLALVFAPVFALGLVAPMLIGIVLARMRILEEPTRHLPLLRRLAVGGIAVSVVGAVPFAIAVGTGGDVLGSHAAIWAAVQGVAGLAGGVGYVAAIAWWAAPRGSRQRGRRATSWIVTAVAATGERSASAYLAQSLLLAPMLAPWGIGLGGRLGSAGVALLAVGVWVVTVLASAALAAVGSRGPAEAFLRRVSYGRR